MADAFGALIGIDFVKIYAFVDGFIRTLRLANVTIYALLGDH
jgi:hypothetical protein